MSFNKMGANKVSSNKVIGNKMSGNKMSANKMTVEQTKSLKSTNVTMESATETTQVSHSQTQTDEVPAIITKSEEEQFVFPKSSLSGVDELLRTWAEVSRVNFFGKRLSSEKPVRSASMSIRRRSFAMPPNPPKEVSSWPWDSDVCEKDIITEKFILNVTSLMNEDQLWGCFYIFPELYADEYSPVVRVRDTDDVKETVAGVLTRDLISACLSYLKRTPILGDYVYIKLDLSSKHLINIEVLQHYKYLVYLDLSSNLLTNIAVLSHMKYLQYLSVAFNRLDTVLEYDEPQWFLTEVVYKFNSVKKIKDLSVFWSITVLDLSHNNIKSIYGLENLKYLRRLDLSFNHIQRLENLNHMRLLWLDLSYNNISSFEFGPYVGLWTLLHLEYLNLNENNLTSMKMFSGCARLRELLVRNNRLGTLLELAVYMRKLRRLIVLDLRGNTLCSLPGYKDVIINTFPVLLSLDELELDPVDKSTYKMELKTDVNVFATRRLLRLLYIEQLSKSRVSPYVPPADTTEVPIVILVGNDAVGKGQLARRLAEECASNVELALLHTTNTYHTQGHFIELTPERFDDMLVTGEFLTYHESDGFSYGLSREQAYINGGKVKITSMPLLPAIMMEKRGRRPFLILVSCSDENALARRQQTRKEALNEMYNTRTSVEVPIEKSTTLQVLVSGRILITGILNEILLSFPDEKEESEFLLESECSLLMDSDHRQAIQDKNAMGVNMLTLLASSATSLEEVAHHECLPHQGEDSLYSLYKDSYNTDVSGSQYHDKRSNLSRPKSTDFTRYVSSTWKGLSMMNSAKSSKSVTFTSQEGASPVDPSGLLVESAQGHGDGVDVQDTQKKIRSISTKLPLQYAKTGEQNNSTEDMNLWFSFLTETGILQTSALNVETVQSANQLERQNTKVDDPSMIIEQMDRYKTMSTLPKRSTSIRDEYDNIHREYPGMFWDTINSDNKETAFRKLKKIVHDIVDMQSKITPMFVTDFCNLPHYDAIMKKKIEAVNKEIFRQKYFQ